jgi:hypothetical protein
MSFDFKITEHIDSDGNRVLKCGRVIARSPAKHGDLDWKVSFQAAPDSLEMTPKNYEMVWAIGLIAKAQYDVFREPARSALSIGTYVQEVVNCHSEREIAQQAEIVALNWELHRAWTRK